MYSTFAELSIIDLFFLPYEETAAEPRLKIPPEVLFQSDVLLA